MISKYFPHVCFIFIIMLWAGCENDGPYPEDQLPVINCLFSSQDSSRVNLSYLKPTNIYEPNQFIRNANVEITFPDNSTRELPYMNNDNIPGNKTEGNFIIPPVISDQTGFYQLTITFPDGHDISSSTFVPEPVRISSIDFHRDSINDQLNILISFIDNKKQQNKYAISIDHLFYVNGTNSSHENLEIQTNTFFVEAEIWGPVSQVVFSDKSFIDSIQNINIEIPDSYLYTTGEMDSTILKVKLLSISEEYYKYAISFHQQVIAEKDFYAEPVNVFNNIKGGYGIFGGYSYHSADIINNKDSIKFRINPIL